MVIKGDITLRSFVGKRDILFEYKMGSITQQRSSKHGKGKDVVIGGDVDWSIHNSSCPNYVGGDSSIHALLTGGRS